MLPAIAATVISAFTRPGDLVVDPMCGIGTTLVEAIHLGRDAAGVEYEPDFVHLALGNLQHARSQGATGTAHLPAETPATSPPSTGPCTGKRRWSSPHHRTDHTLTGTSAQDATTAAERSTSATTATPPTAETSPTSPYPASWTALAASLSAAPPCCGPAV
ncbi:TRM11 family SAM-dependent methyltransferase [Actinomadura geliboluensis]|uniref:TRM11 family SAM-dependent methyltransferase n=1 Tax=Actinomadura geliboluensis TaxID=882440 RepID=UPI003B968C97